MLKNITQVFGYKENAGRIVTDFATFQLALHQKHTIAGFWLNGSFVVSVSDPVWAKKLLHDNGQRPAQLFHFLDEMLGQKIGDVQYNENALPAKQQKERNDFLKRQFTNTFLAPYLPILIQHIKEALFSEWNAVSRSNQVVTLGRNLQMLTLRFITHYVYGELMKAVQREKFIEQFAIALEESLALASDPNNIARKTKLHSALEFINNMADELIAQQLSSEKNKNNNVLSRIVNQTFATDSIINRRIQRFQLHVVVMGGSHTIESTILFVMYCLAKHPGVLARVQVEMDEFLSNKEITIAALRNMRFTECVIREAQRHYPSAPYAAREIMQDMEVGDYSLPKGTMVFIPTWAMNRDQNYWGPTVHEFNPSRFERGGEGKGRYLPSFGDGSISCPAENFSVMVEKVILAVLLRDFSVSLPDNLTRNPLEVSATFVLKPTKNICLKIHSRGAAPLPLEEIPANYKIAVSVIVICILLYWFVRQNINLSACPSPAEKLGFCLNV